MQVAAQRRPVSQDAIPISGAAQLPDGFGLPGPPAREPSPGGAIKTATRLGAVDAPKGRPIWIPELGGQADMLVPDTARQRHG